MPSQHLAATICGPARYEEYNITKYLRCSSSLKRSSAPWNRGFILLSFFSWLPFVLGAYFRLQSWHSLQMGNIKAFRRRSVVNASTRTRYTSFTENVSAMFVCQAAHFTLGRPTVTAAMPRLLYRPTHRHCTGTAATSNLLYCRLFTTAGCRPSTSNCCYRWETCETIVSLRRCWRVTQRRPI